MDYLNEALVRGEAKGELTDKVAEGLRQQIQRPNARIFIKVVAESELLDQPECKRLRLEFSAPGTALQLTAGGTKDLFYEMRMSMCPNGRPPNGARKPAEPILTEKKAAPKN